MVEAIREGDIPGVQIRCRQRLGCTVDQAWEWLRDTSKQARWLADTVEPQTDGEGWVWKSPAGVGGALAERVVAVREEKAPRLWALVFEPDGAEGRATDLTFELSPAGDGCELSVLQHGFQRLPLSTCLTVWERYRLRWRQALGRLEAAVRT